MNRVIVIGCPGSGKSTFSRALRDRTGLPLFPLDRMWWRPDGSHLTEEEFRPLLANVLRGESYIVDGNFPTSMEERFAAADTVFFLDYPVEVCLGGIAERTGKTREDVPWIVAAGEVDSILHDRVVAFEHAPEGKPLIEGLMAKYPDREFHVFRSRAEAQAYLDSL